MKLTDGEKLIILMLSDLYEKLGIKGEIDPHFIKEAIFRDHLWGIRWKLSGIPFEKAEAPEIVEKVLDILEMWFRIEEDYENLSNEDKVKLEASCVIAPKFLGFDGNNEGEYMSVAQFLVNDLDRFDCFKGRNFNSHSRSLNLHQKMLSLFQTISNRLTQGSLGVNDLIARRKGQSMRSIATELGIAHSTVGRELKRNTGKRGYRHQQANHFAQQRHAVKHKSIKMNQEVKRLIKSCLALDWSPEQICGWFSIQHIINLHHESVYRYLLKDKEEGGLLYKHLRHQGKPYRKRYGCANNRTGIPDRVDIEERPQAVNNREVFGHWEADTIIGKAHQGAIVTTDERISKVRLAYPVKTKHKDNVSAAMCTLLKPVSEAVHSITYDNGKEFAGHQQVNKTLNCKSYFAKPYRSWERGQNENANGLLRQYFPKSMSLIHVSLNEVKIAVNKLNTRPRKCLGFKTPYQVFLEQTGIDASLWAVVRL